MAESLLLRCCTSMLADREMVTLSIHVTKALQERSRPYQRSTTTGPALGDNSPQIIDDWDQRSCRGPTGQHPSILLDERATKKVTGALLSTVAAATIERG
ncbi:hypothetical protein [Kocuria sp. CPCC 204721]|uniref:hypothetical protein n=1 Tax=Kocuria sp. CPCC 204721 TaxID=3073548 RepID=UPI0034D3DD74